MRVKNWLLFKDLSSILALLLNHKNGNLQRRKKSDFTKGHVIVVLFYETILHCNQLEELAGFNAKCVFL